MPKNIDAAATKPGWKISAHPLQKILMPENIDSKNYWCRKIIDAEKLFMPKNIDAKNIDA